MRLDYKTRDAFVTLCRLLGLLSPDGGTEQSRQRATWELSILHVRASGPTNMAVTMLELIFFLIGVALAVALSQPGIEYVQRLRRHITWRQFQRAVTITLTQHLSGEWSPDVIVGLNSGIVPASIIALNLRVSEIYFYDCLPEYRQGVRVDGYVQDKDIDLSGKNVLIVDDQAYTGQSLEMLYRHLTTDASADPKRTKRHVLFVHKSGAGPIQVDIPPSGSVLGGVKRMPWVISDRLRVYWEHRTG